MKNENASNKRLLFGLFLIALGALWMLVKLDVIPSLWSDILISWQMLLIGIGIFSLIGGNRVAGYVLIVIGGFFLVPEVLNIPYEIRRIGWPLIIIGIGLVLLLTQHRKRNIENFSSDQKGMNFFDDFVVFGGREILINSQNFFGGKITAIFGGAEYDLRQAKLSQNGAVIDCVTVFGGSGFKVPPEWNVKNEVSTIFGAFSDKRGVSAHEINNEPEKTLIIKGFSAFGGVEIKYH